MLSGTIGKDRARWSTGFSKLRLDFRGCSVWPSVVIDTHCHLDVAVFETDRAAVWQRARAAGVHSAVIPGIEPATWGTCVAVARSLGLHVALGIHPQALPELTDAEVDAGLAGLESALRESRAVAVGECGFDGGVDLGRASFERQTAVVAAHLEIARTLGLPVVLHVLRAHETALTLLRRVRLPERPGVIHSYSGSAELAHAYLALGFFLSFAGGVTRPRARRPVQAARAIPLERMLAETDAPDQRPTGATTNADDCRCEPADLVFVVRRLAEIRGMDEAELRTRLDRNACALFDLSPEPA